ncbi:MAG: ester cyclase [Pseudonocardiales bacterium]|nr:ester cyclase [Pseudonocardiales bacterium]
MAVRYTARATHTGELFGAPPSGRTVTITGIEIYRLAGGSIVEYSARRTWIRPGQPSGYRRREGLAE